MKAEQGESVNPYAAPDADLQPSVSRADSVGQGDYYAMSETKVFVMSLLTVGLYDLVFWWRHWRARQAAGQPVSPFWRTLFSPFFAFDFRSSVYEGLLERLLVPHSFLHSAPLVYLGSHIIDNLLDRLGADGVFMAILSCLFEVASAYSLFVLQRSVNQLLAARGYQGPVNRGASAKTYLMGAVGVSLWAAVLWSYVYAP